MRHHPQRSAVAVDDHRLACAHTVDPGVASAHRHQRRVIRVRRTHDGDGELFFAKGTDQPLFAGDLVARILPEGIGERGRFADGQVDGRLLISRGRADTDRLPAPDAI